MVNLDEEIDQAGGLGIFQRILIITSAVLLSVTAANMGASIFEAMMPDTRCKSPFEDDVKAVCPEDYNKFLVPEVNDQPSNCKRYNFTNADDIISAVTRDENSTANCSLGIYPIEIGLVDCTEWHFDRSVMRSTIITDFNLVCRSQWAGYFSQSALMIGVAVGSVFTGYLSDRIGRRHALLIVCIGATISGTLLGFVKSFLAYSVLRIIVGMFAFSPFLVLFVYASELTIPRYRSITAQAIQLSFPIGLLYLAMAAYLLREWRRLQLAIAIPFVVGVVIWRLIPESPRWLCQNGRHDEALKVIEKVARINRNEHKYIIGGKEKVQHILSEKVNLVEKKNSVDKNTMGSIFKKPHLRSASFKMFYNWFVVSAVYYGLTMNAADLDGDPFRNLCLTSVAEIVADLVTIPLANFCGRRATACGTEIMAGVMCILLIVVPPGGVLPVATLGKFAISISFCTMFIHANEIYPTPVRSFGLGLCSAMARVGGVFSPIVVMSGMVYIHMPYIIFGTLSIVAGLLVLTLPETRGIMLPQTIQEGEDFLEKGAVELPCASRKKLSEEIMEKRGPCWCR